MKNKTYYIIEDGLTLMRTHIIARTEFGLKDAIKIRKWNLKNNSKRKIVIVREIKINER